MKTTAKQNKRLVLKAFDTLFNKRDYAAAEKLWSPSYIQHSAHIEPGREGLFNLVKNTPSTLKYEPGRVVADGDFVILHGRFSGFGLPVNWIVADILRIENGLLPEFDRAVRLHRFINRIEEASESGRRTAVSDIWNVASVGEQ